MHAAMSHALLVPTGAALLAGRHGARPAAIGVNRRRLEAILARWKELP